MGADRELIGRYSEPKSVFVENKIVLSSPKIQSMTMGEIKSGKKTHDQIKSLLTLSWTLDELSELYHWQASIDPNFKKIFHEEKVADQHQSILLRLPEVVSGSRVYVRVRSENGKFFSPWSKTVSDLVRFPVSVPSTLAENSLPPEKVYSVPYNVLRIYAGLNFTGLNSQKQGTSGQATDGSNLNEKFGIGFQRRFTQKFSLGLVSDVNFSSFYGNSAVTVANTQSIFSRSLLYAGYAIIPRLVFIGRISFDQHPLLASGAKTDLEVDVVSSLGFGGGISWTFFETGKFHISAEGGGGVLMPSSTKSQAVLLGYDYYGNFKVMADLSAGTFLEAIPYLNQDSQNTVSLIGGTSEVGLKMDYGIKF